MATYVLNFEKSISKTFPIPKMYVKAHSSHGGSVKHVQIVPIRKSFVVGLNVLGCYIEIVRGLTRGGFKQMGAIFHSHFARFYSGAASSSPQVEMDDGVALSQFRTANQLLKIQR